MVIFVDESYKQDSKGLWHYALADKIIAIKSVDEVELKASSLLSPGNLKRFGEDRSPHYRLVSEIFDTVYKCRGTCIGILANPISPKIVKDCTDGCPPVYTKFINTVGRWMSQEYPGIPATLVLDTEHNGVNIPLSRSIADYLYRSSAGKRMRHVFPSPF